MLIICGICSSCSYVTREDLTISGEITLDVAEAVIWLNDQSLHQQTSEELMESFQIANDWLSAKDYIGDDVKESFVFISQNADAIKWFLETLRTYRKGEITPSIACSIILDTAQFWRQACE